MTACYSDALPGLAAPDRGRLCDLSLDGCVSPVVAPSAREWLRVSVLGHSWARARNELEVNT